MPEIGTYGSVGEPTGVVQRLYPARDLVSPGMEEVCKPKPFVGIQWVNSHPVEIGNQPETSLATSSVTMA